MIAEGINYQAASGLKKFEIRSLYTAHPKDLESWFAKIESRIKEELEICETVLAAAQASGVDARKIEFCRAKLLRGVTLNNPKIPMQLVRQNATSLDPHNSQVASEQIKQFVRNNPLPEPQSSAPSTTEPSGKTSLFE